MDDTEKERLRTPMWCPICDITMRDNPKYYYVWGCCLLCYIEFIEHREERWRGGWRPSQEEVARFVEKVCT